MNSLPNVQAQANDGSEIDSRRQSSVDRGDDPRASEEQEYPAITEERAGLLSGVLTDEESQNSSPREVIQILLLRMCLIVLLVSMLVGTIPLAMLSKAKSSNALYSNGTHEFRNTVLLVSFDGFRSDYLDRNITPTIQEFIQKGVRAEYMIPSFPSMTFPNHYTIVTGLYPESHGIVANEFYDPVLKDDFFYEDPNRSFDSKWWKGEPIWVTTVKQHQKSGTSMWVGSSSVIGGYTPTYLHPFSNNLNSNEKVNHLINWLDMELMDRPTFLAGYVNIVDSTAHKFGPDSQELNDALKSADEFVKDLLNNIEKRNLTDIINIIFVSDHGMAQMIPSNIIYLDDIFDISKVRPIEWYPLAGIRPYNDSDIEEIFSLLQNASANQLWKCYLRENIPKRFHYRNSVRIDPIVCIPPVGGAFTTHNNEQSHIGVHGYDNQEPTMRGIFLANGPYFKDKGNEVGNERIIESFVNVEVYNIMCNILGLEPAPNNGTDGAII